MTTITFPTLSRAAPRETQWGLKSNTQVFTSPLNGSVQTVELPGARWTTQFAFNGLEEADASLMRAFLAQARGQARRVALYPYHRSAPRGSIALSGVTLGAAAAQFATTCTLNGCGAAGTLKAGDYFAVAGELKMVVADATADGAGVATGVTFEPPVRAAAGWSSAASVTTNKPTALFILNDPHVRWSTKPGLYSDFALDFTEVFE